MTGPFEVTLISNARVSSSGSKTNKSGKAIMTSKTRFVRCTEYLQPWKKIPDLECEHEIFSFTPTAEAIRDTNGLWILARSRA
jgi:outer membrane usher protein FimD/PapC